MPRKVKLIHQGAQTSSINAPSWSDEAGTDFDHETHRGKLVARDLRQNYSRMFSNDGTRGGMARGQRPEISGSGSLFATLRPAVLAAT